MTKVEFLSRLKEEQLSQYSYTELPDTFLQADKITILCSTHGPFEQQAQSHLLGCGCPTCAREAKGGKEKTLSKLLEKHGGKIKLVSPFPKNQREQVTFECSTHGMFESTLRRVLLWEHGCPTCAQNARNKKQRWTWDQVKEKASEKHGGKYTYPDQTYVNTPQKISIICPVHGEFSQKAMQHILGASCPRCAKEKDAQKRSMSLKTFLARAASVHGGKYDYTNSVYSSARDKIEVTCKKHGSFWQAPYSHLRGVGCPKCGNEAKALGTEEFISKALNVHGDTYDYTNSVYISSRDKIEISCRKHGSFWQRPADHTRGRGCTKCATEAMALSKTSSTEEFISKALDVHGDAYGYANSVYITTRDKIEISCKKHGSFWQRPAAHLKGSGCPTCGAEASILSRTFSTEDFIPKALDVHGDAYDYTPSVYISSLDKIEISCRKHGSFWQRPDDHLHGHGCPTCGAGNISRAEVELKELLESLVPPDEVRTQVPMRRDSVRRYLDLAVPSLGLGIEFNGLYWHSEQYRKTATYHREKSQICLDSGYKDIIHIFEDDWLHRRHAVEHLLRYKLTTLPALMARKLTVGNVEHKAARAFYTSYHMQGPSIAAGQLHYGLYQQDELVAVMSFTQHSSGRRKLEAGHWELVRFASKYRVQGGASKLFKAFTKEHSPQSVLSFSWSHLFNGNVYQVLGFKLDKELPPDYMYVDKRQCRRLHKAGFQHSKLRQKLDNYDPTLTEK